MAWLWPDEASHALIGQDLAECVEIKNDGPLAQGQAPAEQMLTLPTPAELLAPWHKALGTFTAAFYMEPQRPGRCLHLLLGRGAEVVGKVSIGLDDAARQSQAQQLSLLMHLQQQPLAHTMLPELVPVQGQTAICLPAHTRQTQLTQTHWSALQAWQAQTAKPCTLGSLAWWTAALQRVEALEDAPSLYPQLVPMLRILAERVQADMPVLAGLHHGNFCPKYTAVAEGKLLAWHWLQATMAAPLGLDAMHFVWESYLASGRVSFSLLQARLQALAGPLGPMLVGFSRHQQTLSALYLVDAVGRYMAGHKADDIHDAAVRRRLALYNDALRHCLQTPKAGKTGGAWGRVAAVATRILPQWAHRMATPQHHLIGSVGHW